MAETPSDSEPNTETREGVWSRYRNLREAYRLCVSSQNAFINSVKIFLAADVIQEEPAAPDSGAHRERFRRRPDADAATTNEGNQWRRIRRNQAKAYSS